MRRCNALVSLITDDLLKHCGIGFVGVDYKEVLKFSVFVFAVVVIV